MSGRKTAAVLAIIVILAGAFVWQYRSTPWIAAILGPAPVVQTELARVSYVCNDNKTLSAVYYQGATSTVLVKPNTPPTPTGSVSLTLSDGRFLPLPQTISASGIRYANADESVVFWSKGNTAFITEGKTQTPTFSNCIARSNISGQESWNTYATSSLGYSVRYPGNFTINPSYINSTLGPGKDIPGVQMVIPAAMATGTNLAADSGVSVEELSGVTDCQASLFLSDTISSSTITDNGTSYSVAKGSDAGAGNLYNETVYALPGSSPCTAVRYFIHSTQLGNYPAGTVTAFNQNELLSLFDGIRVSLLLAR